MPTAPSSSPPAVPPGSPPAPAVFCPKMAFYREEMARSKVEKAAIQAAHNLRQAALDAQWAEEDIQAQKRYAAKEAESERRMQEIRTMWEKIPSPEKLQRDLRRILAGLDPEVEAAGRTMKRKRAGTEGGKKGRGKTEKREERRAGGGKAGEEDEQEGEWVDVEKRRGHT